ncbi:MAG: RNA degradosome polyphosphate kinase [Lachnospiraceae bacterium]|nr:RNA degradosome polyphosphate kinase [Lachnospiraceae bacterium]
MAKRRSVYGRSEYYTNRELSWVKFDERVLREAKNKQIPLFERLKFLSITASNLDEFFMIRVASLKDMVNADYEGVDLAGLTPMEQLNALTVVTHEFVRKQYNVLNHSLIPLLHENKVELIGSHEKLDDKDKRFIDKFFMESVYPVLTPMAVDSSRPFPLIRNNTLNIGALLSKKDKKEKGKNKEFEFATVQVPSVLDRLVRLQDRGGKARFILLEEIIERNIDKLFLNYNVLCANPFRIMRNADLTIEEDEAADLLKEIERQLKKRQWGQVIRLEAGKDMDKRLLKLLIKELAVGRSDVYLVNGPLDLTFLSELYDVPGYESLKEKKYTPQPVPEIPAGSDIFECIRQGDILMHHPYETFEPVVEFIKRAATDKDVLAIKQTLYRVSGDSPIIKALALAAENGKQVTVLVELKARFDEEHNIVWAKMLEKAGCHVIYGLVGLKTHCKITLIVRREEQGIKRYVHLGTGNYNDSTAKLYSDLGLFTCKEAFGEDATAVFNMLSGYSEPETWNRLSLAPLWLKDHFLKLIKRERDNVKKGKTGRIIAKMNSLCDKDIIEALYEASNAGVSIDLIVRGICSLKVGIPGISENIRVRSIVGTFLEHSRIFYFYNDGNPEYYLGSADWMPRNLERRVEILFPIEDQKLREMLWHILDLELRDTVKATCLTPEGTYVKITGRGKKLNSQSKLCDEAVSTTKRIKSLAKKKERSTRVFIPEVNKE